MDTRGLIKIDRCDLNQIIRSAYALSNPVGMGHMHFVPGPLDDITLKGILESRRNDRIWMDYVRGRHVKLRIYEQDGYQYISSRWFDHTDNDLVNLLQKCGYSEVEADQMILASRKEEEDRRDQCD